MVHDGHEAGAEYTAGVTVDEEQLGHELHEEQLVPHDEQPQDSQPQTGLSTTALVSVTGRAQVVQEPHEPHEPQELHEEHELQGLHDEQVEQAGAYDAHVEQPEEYP